MNIELFCVWCGGRLVTEDRHVACVSCGTELSNMLISETKYEDPENTFLEMSVSMDCVKVKSRCKYPSEIYPVAIEESAIVSE